MKPVTVSRKSIGLRLPISVEGKFLRKAEAQGMTPSEYARDIIIKALPLIDDFEEILELAHRAFEIAMNDDGVLYDDLLNATDISEAEFSRIYESLDDYLNPTYPLVLVK